MKSYKKNQQSVLCSICLDVFTDPVTTPCGHNFCKNLKMSKDAADKQKTEGVQIFTVLKEFIEKGLKKVIKEIEDKQETTEKQAEGLIKELEEEISELKKRSSELKQASRSEDHLHFIQSFSSLKAVPPTKDWTEVILEETLKKHFKKLLAKAELRRVQQYAVDVSLDPDTAHPELILSDDGKQVNFGDVNQSLSDNPKRFTVFANVLGRQGFSSGRFYFEVQVKGKTDWILGVARESVNRKGGNSVKPQDGFWALWLRNNNEYTACTGPAAVLSLASAPDKVGVFVDYEERLVSFYDVYAAASIYSFTGCSFTEKLYPCFNPCNNDNGKNSAPLVITPINSH
uniref:B30.2/SPRY domain-containing protein n=1 Tax=Oreochromis aureus TaxID=47969 RepID=A0A668RZZ3_OREAU